MFTVCPKCTLTLAVTAADLRTGQGYVRCGRCLNVFNALLGLSEEPAEGGAAAPVYSQADPASALQISAALASSANDAGNFDDAAGAAEQAGASEPLGHVPADNVPRSYLVTERSSDGAIENESSLAEGTGSFETIVLEGDAITQTEEFVPEESIEHEIAALTQRLSEAQQERDEFAAGAADRENAIGEQIVARAAGQFAPRLRLSGAHIYDIGIGIVGEAIPDSGSAANLPPLVTRTPCLGRHFEFGLLEGL